MSEKSDALVLYGEVVGGEQAQQMDREIQRLKREVTRLQDALNDAKGDAARVQRDAARALTNLRRQLSPLYHALQDVFGELDASGLADQPLAPLVAGTAVHSLNNDPRVIAVWTNWKQKLGVGPGKIIDALLLHTEMNTQQLSIATGYHRNTVPQYISELNKAGLINKKDGRFSLKAL
jgi:DNA-binding transcriptional regulator GbsR (MarR family)